MKILIIIYFAFYPINVLKESSQLSSFSQDISDVEIEVTEELNNIKHKRLPKAIIIGALKCGNIIKLW